MECRCRMPGTLWSPSWLWHQVDGPGLARKGRQVSHRMLESSSFVLLLNGRRSHTLVQQAPCTRPHAAIAIKGLEPVLSPSPIS